MAGESDSGEQLDFDAWARLSARLLKRTNDERAAILGAEHVDPGAYRATDAHWSAILAADLSDGRTRWPERYAAACAEEMRDRTPLPAAPAPEAPAPEPAPPPEEPVPAPATVEVEVPSFLREGSFSHPYVTGPSLPLPAIPEPPPPPAPGGTLDVASIVAGSALPFMDKSAAPPPPPPPAPRSAPPPAPGSGGTQDVDAILARAVLPFAGARQAARTSEVSMEEVSVGGFTMHQYASLCAELAVYAHQTDAVLLRYGLPDERARRHLADQWQQKLVEDPALLRAWTELCAQYRDWLVQKRR